MGKERKLTPKQEKFAKLYVELSNASEAYRRAYDVNGNSDNAIHVAASRLLDNAKVALRVNQIQVKLQDKHDVTMDSLTTEYEEARALADRIDDPKSMVAATTGKAKLHGMLIEKRETTFDIADVLKGLGR